MALTLPGVLLTGDHASRPAAGDVAKGCLYSCTTSGHPIYQSDGSSWSTWRSSASVADILDLPTAEMDDSLVLAPDGAGGVEFRAEAGGGGALILLEQHTASGSAQLDFTSFISGTYDEYMIEGVELAPATNAANMRLIVGTGGGPTYDTGNNYEWAWGTITTGGSNVNDYGSTGLSSLFSSMSNNAGYGFGSFTMRATGLQSTAHRKTFLGDKHFVNSSPSSVFGSGGIQWTNTGTAATALRFNMSSGNIASGTIRIYGIAK
jgi:hypothetical protein